MCLWSIKWNIRSIKLILILYNFIQITLISSYPVLTSRCKKQIRLWSYDFALNSLYFVLCVYMHRPWLKASNISRPITSAICNLFVCFCFVLFCLLFVCLFVFLFSQFLLYWFPPFHSLSFSFLEIYFILGALGHHNFCLWYI